MTLKEKALRLALVAHKDQLRKSDGSPYISHPIMVAMLLQEYGFNEAVIAAGLTHDVLEDTTVTEEELRAELGVEVVAYVTAVSEDTSLEWEDRKARYVASVVAASEGAKAVCIADKIHNAESVISDYKQKGKDVWKPFNRGKAKKLWFEDLVHSEVSKSWNHPLLARYKTAIDILHTLEE
jgi:(p)ppGpp synthase/HD superfamily hydrolase